MEHRNPVTEGKRLTEEVGTFSSNPWLITFGDMLTLLLCFFLCFVTFGPLQTKSLQDTHSSPSSGIDLAKHMIEPAVAPEILTELAPADFGDSQEMLNPVGQEKIKSAVHREGYDLELLSFEVCPPKDKQGPEFWTLGILMELRSQLLDAGVPDERLEARILGTGCGSEASLARLSATFKKTAV